MGTFLLPVYRVRSVILGLSVVALIAAPLARSVSGASAVDAVSTVATIAGMLGILAALGLTVAGPRLLPDRPPVVVASPVVGRWLALNSPATKVPSHGVRAYGQAYAIDLVSEPVGETRPQFGEGDAWKVPEAFPAFGSPVRAMLDGVVVRAWDRLRDHRSRSSYPAFALFALEGMLRELGGPRFVVGNHVVIRSDDGIYAVVAHLRRGSIRVSPGERVQAGQVIAECGNTGNSTEPHVHAQLMDRASLVTAQGIPFVFAGVRIGDEAETRDAVPADGEHLLTD